MHDLKEDIGMTVRYDAVDWNEQIDGYTQDFWNQNTTQFWLEKEFPVTEDKNTWNNDLNDAQRFTYVHALAGLTFLDTRQGGEGMPLIGLHVHDLQQKAVISFMGAMEQVHAKSYSTIFTTLIPRSEERQALFKWVETNKHLKYKADVIVGKYLKLFNPNASEEEIFMAMVASVLLESFLFYSGFFYPLYLKGQGKMTKSGEIIDLILRDEAIHGAYIGLLAYEKFQRFDAATQVRLQMEVYDMVEGLYQNEVAYSQEVYGSIGMVDQVEKFLRYNANKALQNFGFEPYFEEEQINSIVENGIKIGTKIHDFFSLKGNGYKKAIVAPITDDDFVFDIA
jgi:ribonucleoside-diphosphate reductase beta chain